MIVFFMTPLHCYNLFTSLRNTHFTISNCSCHHYRCLNMVLMLTVAVMVPLQIVPKQRMIFVTGPAAAGRAALLDQVMKQVDREINDKIIADAADAAAAAKKKKNSNNSNNKNDVDVPKKRFRIGKLLTSNEAYKTSSSGAAAASSWYEYISASALQELRDSGDVLFEGVDRDANGNIIDVSV